MRTVIIRDDDTNALTPVECLEKLYRPFLARGLPVNLAVIPDVRTDTRLPDGRLEGFLRAKRTATAASFAPFADNLQLVEYLRHNPGFHLAQHGCHHDYFEFDRMDRLEIVRRLELGARRLHEAGIADVPAFVAPYDKLSPVAFEEVAKRFRVLSTGWFEWRRVPTAWWPRYLLKKLLRRPHWQVGPTRLLSHPGCLLSYTRPLDAMLESVKRAVARQEVTVLVTHWWEYFRQDGRPDERFIGVLHETAAFLAGQRDLRVVSFGDLATSKVALRLQQIAKPLAAGA